MKPDHSSALESLAARHGVSPLLTLELFLERAAIREYLGGMSREYAEHEAVRDVAEILAGLPSAASSAASASAASQMQSFSRRNPGAKTEGL